MHNSLSHLLHTDGGHSQLLLLVCHWWCKAGMKELILTLQKEKKNEISYTSLQEETLS